VVQLEKEINKLYDDVHMAENRESKLKKEMDKRKQATENMVRQRDEAE
jgi:hypothetical protein